MSDSPLTPPPPPNRKPVPPPPPPGKGPAPMPALAPLSMPPAPGANLAFGGSQAPGMATAAPTLPRPLNIPGPSLASMGTPPAAAVSAMEQRMQDMEKRFQEQENSKKLLETQLGELQKELRAEHEKLLVQSIKVKEDENLSVRVDQQLREIQERLRREKYEQEIQDSRGKAENQLKEIERRLSQERETWMLALKNQMKERETVEHDAEHAFGRRLREFERRYEEEKNTWTQGSRQKEEEVHQLRRDFQLEMEQWRHSLQEKDAQMEEVKEMAVQQRRGLEMQAQSELRDLQGRLDNQIREAGAWKAQMALLQTQMQQAEIHRQEEKSRFESQVQILEKEQQSELRRQESLAETRLEEVQRDFTRRESERVQHWEGLLAQVRMEKESLVRHMTQREEELLHAQRGASELRRLLDLEKTQRQSEADHIRRKAFEDAEQRMPELYNDKLAGEKKKWQEQADAEIAAVKAETARVALSEKALHAKLEIEERRMAQENEAWSRRLKESETKRENLQQSFAGIQQEMAQVRTTLQAEKAHAVLEFEQAKAQWEQDKEASLAHLAQLRVTMQAEQAHAADERQQESKEFLRQQAVAQEKARAALTAMQTRQAELEKKIQGLDQQLIAKENAATVKSRETEGLKNELAALQRRFENNVADLMSQRGALQKLSQEQAAWTKKEQEWRHAQVEWTKKEQEWQQAQGQMNDALNGLRAQLVESQNERNARDVESQNERNARDVESQNERNARNVEWQARENAWKGEKMQLEQRRAALDQKNNDLEKAVAQALEKVQAMEAAPKPAVGSPEALSALAAMRQSMTEMTQLLAWARSGQKPALNAKAA